MFGLAILGVGAFFYTAFFGTPWKKATIAKELEAFVEKKYAIDVRLKEKTYNFKDGSYGAIFALDENPKLSFGAEQLTNGKIFEYYPEAVWVAEAEKDVYPVLQKSFPSLSLGTYSIAPVYGVGRDLNIKEDIPSYKNVETGIGLAVHFHDVRTKEKEEVLVKEAFTFVSSLQKKGIKNLDVRLYLGEKATEEQKTKTFSISIEGEDLLHIKTEEDVKKYINIF